MARSTITKKPFETEPKDPDTVFHRAGHSLSFTVLTFWRWAHSNFVSSASRGNLAEFIVARAIDAVGEVRTTWDEVDLRTRAGIAVEVKSSAYLQDWGQNKLSRPSFSIGSSRAWHKEHGRRAPTARRHADVYVFCLLHHQDPETLDPLNLDQWTFYVVPTAVLNSRYSGQKTLTLGKVVALTDIREARKTAYEDIAAAMKWAVAER